MLRSILIYFLVYFTCLSVKGQVTISGRVTDAASREPLMNATVYCQNTTIGTFTDNQGNFTLKLPSGGYDLVITYTGYNSKIIPVTEATTSLKISLVKGDKTLSEVIVKSKASLVENGWELYGNLFMENFIGSTPNAEDCKLENHDALRFYYFSNGNKVKVFARAPLKISNHSLGYTLTYQLDSFVYYFDPQLYAYQGNCQFTEMEGDERKKKNWLRNRKQAYEGSVLHFMRSYYNIALQKEGWEIGMEQVKDSTTFDKVVNPYDTLYMKNIKKTGQYEISYPRRIKVSYRKKGPEPEYLKRFLLPKGTAIQSSVVEMATKIFISRNGYYSPVSSWITYNYWSWKNLADLLPYDYDPQQQ